jgi:hypothetical protein
LLWPIATLVRSAAAISAATASQVSAAHSSRLPCLCQSQPVQIPDRDQALGGSLRLSPCGIGDLVEQPAGI